MVEGETDTKTLFHSEVTMVSAAFQLLVNVLRVINSVPIYQQRWIVCTYSVQYAISLAVQRGSVGFILSFFLRLKLPLLNGR